jgi:glycosyltransferase involved in cell wall biosynthesis
LHNLYKSYEIEENMNIVITIPAYNEEKTLPRVIAEIRDVLKEQTNKEDQYTILVVDDGSTDNTVNVAHSLDVEVVAKRHTGLAGQFKREMEECLRLNADIIVHTDADGQYHPQHIPELVAKVKEGNDLVLGSRFKYNMKHMPILKRIGNIAFAKVISSLTKTKISDSTTGYRAFTAEVARDIEYINTFTYTQEQLIKAAKQGFSIAEVPIKCRKTRASRLFSNPLQYAIKAWINIFRIYRDYNPLRFFGRIGLSFLSVGVAIGLWLVYRFITLGRIGKVPTAILCMLLIMIGIQVTLFGFLADMIKR